MTCRGQPEQNTGNKRNQSSKAQNRKINRNAITAGKAASRQARKKRHCGPGQGKPQSRAGNSHQDALCQKLANNVKALGAQSHADRHFAPTACGADKQKIGNIRAGNQEHKSHRPDQDPKRSAHVLHNLVQHGINQRRNVRVSFRILLLQLFGNHGHL